MEAILCLSRQLTIKPIHSSSVCLHKPTIINRHVNLSFNHHAPFTSLNLQAWPTHQAHPKTWATNASLSPKMYGGDEGSKLPGAARLAAAVLIGVLGAMCLRKMTGQPHLAAANARPFLSFSWLLPRKKKPLDHFYDLVRGKDSIQPGELQEVVKKLIEDDSSNAEEIAKELKKRYEKKDTEFESEVEIGLIRVYALLLLGKFTEALDFIQELERKQGGVPPGSLFGSRFNELKKAAENKKILKEFPVGVREPIVTSP